MREIMQKQKLSKDEIELIEDWLMYVSGERGLTIADEKLKDKLIKMT